MCESNFVHLNRKKFNIAAFPPVEHLNIVCGSIEIFYHNQNYEIDSDTEVVTLRLLLLFTPFILEMLQLKKRM